MKLKRRDDGFEIELRDGLTIGRVAASDLTIADSSVSRKHAKIRADGGAFVLCDLDSANGTTCNGLREKEMPLHGGDTVVFGRVVFDALAEQIEAKATVIDAAPFDRALIDEPAPSAPPSADAYQPTAADEERARLRREAVSGRRSSGLGDLSQQTPLIRFLIYTFALAFLAAVIFGVRWMAHTVSGG